MNNITSIGKFSSSQIYRLMGSEKVAQTYIKEKNFERLLLRKLDNESNSRPTSWGNFMEGYTFEKLPINYILCSKTTVGHPEYGSFWVGTPDDETDDSIGDIKNPFTLMSFVQLNDACSKGLLLNYEDSYFWQLVSNAIIKNKKYAELIIHVPYEDEYYSIMEYYNSYEDKSDINWLERVSPKSIPLLKRESKFKDLNIHRFEVTEHVKDHLTQNVLKYSKFLI